MRIGEKAFLEATEDEKWVEEQFNAVPGPDDGYTDAQFVKDLDKANSPLEVLAEKARKAMASGTAKKFPR